ncbi:MAG: transaldolase family protein [Nitrospirota bacterium]
MRPKNLKSKIFLDSGDPKETKEIIKLLGFLDGQTTNPTLISKNPDARRQIEQGSKFSKEEILDFYKGVVREISALIPQGSVSVEVYADFSTTSEDILKEGKEMFSWIPNAHIKIPITQEGLKAVEKAVKEGIRLNTTLCFNQEQAAAVYAATKDAKKGDTFVSPFVGRLDDKGLNGMDLISKILKMYRNGQSHVEVLTASVRNIDHLLCALQFGSDSVTVPFDVLKEWGKKGLPMPDEKYVYDSKDLKPIPSEDITLTKNWKDYNINHELTNIGIERFSSDWNALIK